MEFLGVAEVLKPCNSRCKNAKWLVLKHESHHTVRAMVVAKSRTCVRCSICKTSVSVKQHRKLNPCRPENEEVWRFFADFVDPSFKRIPPDADYYVCQKDFQQLGKALNACNSYQAIVREMKLAIGVVIDVSIEGVDNGMSENDMSIGGGTESFSLSGVFKLPKGEASPSAEPDQTTAAITLRRQKLPIQRASGDSTLIKRARLSQSKEVHMSIRGGAVAPVKQYRTPQPLLKVAHNYSYKWASLSYRPMYKELVVYI